MRRKTRKRRTSITRAFLKLLHKLLLEIKILQKEYQLELPKRSYNTLRTIKKVYGQQYLFFTKAEKPKGRIVSLSKNYLRPILRGKEIKGTEFGAKVNKLQIDGINFIQKISFDNFNEGIQFKNNIYKAQGLTKTKVKVVGADAIYATNKNRILQYKLILNPKGNPQNTKRTEKTKSYNYQRKSIKIRGKFW